MKKAQAVKDVNLIAFCGLYCGSCVSFLKGKCPGSTENNKATWCKIRTCNVDSQLSNCAHYQTTHPTECKELNYTIGQIFKLPYKTDRLASLQYITDKGEMAYTDKMYELNPVVIKKNQNLV